MLPTRPAVTQSLLVRSPAGNPELCVLAARVLLMVPSAHRSTGADSGLGQREAGRGFRGTGKVEDLKKKRKKR